MFNPLTSFRGVWWLIQWCVVATIVIGAIVALLNGEHRLFQILGIMR